MFHFYVLIKIILAREDKRTVLYAIFFLIQYYS